ncbi:MAG TPA: acyl-CoA dehydrogenase family protein, partial [Iamia sp.]|nr:acyl-CoA dehydrogenase family protein [Iamia sp.]
MSATAPPSVDELRAEATAFLDGHAERRSTERPFVWGEGDDDVTIVEDQPPEEEQAALAAAQAWARTRWDAGFGWLDGPVDLGGRGLTRGHVQAYRSLEAGYVLPSQSIFTIGLGMVAPTLAVHGSDAIRRQYLPGLHRGNVIACQLFSEPGAGSDLAAVACRAERDGDKWVLTGQKVWTSNAHLAHVGEAICRSDPTQPKHKGMTAFVVPMDAPGVTVRPLRQMSGGAGFNEVFLDGVRVRDDHRLGDIGEGWGVALTTLLNERASLGGGGMGLGRGPGPFERLVALLRHVDGTGDPVLRDRLAALYATHKTLEWTARRGRDTAGDGRPGPEMSVLKLAGTRHLSAISAFVSAALGPALLADTG